MFKILDKKVLTGFSIRSLAVALTTLLVISSISIFLFGFAIAKQITIYDGETKIVITTNRFYLEEILAENNIVLKTGDKISTAPNTRLKNDDVIVITRAKKIELTVDGGIKEVYTCEKTLKEALNEEGIILNQYDEITPVLETEVTDGMEARICRVEVNEVTVEEVVDRGIQKIHNHDLNKGVTKVITEGSDGLASRTYKIITRDGEEISKTLVHEDILTNPIDQVVEYGARNSKVVAASRGEIRYKKVLQVTATAYDSSPASNGIYAGRTATGRKPVYGIVAVDPKVIPLNSRLYIESSDGGKSWVYGYAIAADTGGAIKGNKIDLCFNSSAECYQFGRRSATVYVLE